jgi:hypothetical protein
MSISIKQLQIKARWKIAQGVLALFATFILSGFFMPFGAFILFVGFIVASTYIYSSIGNISCPTCNKPYGVALDFIGNIEVPSKCICCHEQAS